jgi:hypothetical protein
MQFLLRIAFLIFNLLANASGALITTATISESSMVQTSINTITITLQADVELLSSDVVTITGLTGSQTIDTAALVLSGTDAAIFGAATPSTSAWTQITGVLVLTTNTGVAANTDIVVIIQLRNPSAAQTAVTPSVAITGSVTIASTTFASAVLGSATSDAFLTAVATPTDGALLVHVYFDPTIHPGIHMDDPTFEYNLTLVAQLMIDTDGVTPLCHSSYESACPTETNSPLQFSNAPTFTSPTACPDRYGVLSKYATVCQRSYNEIQVNEWGGYRGYRPRINHTLEIHGLTNGYMYNITVKASTMWDDGSVQDENGNAMNTSYTFEESPAGTPLMNPSMLGAMSFYTIDLANGTAQYPVAALRSGLKVAWTAAVPNGRSITSYHVSVTPNATAVQELDKDFDQAFGRYITTKTSDESAAIPTFTTSLVNDYNQTYFEHELTRLIQADAPRYMVYSSVISDQYTYLDTSGCNFLTIVTNATLSSTNEYTAMLRIPSDDLLVGMSVTADTGLASGTTLASFDPANNLTLTFDKAHVQVGNVTLTLTLPCNPPNVTVITTSASLTVESDVPYYVTIQPYNAMGTSEEINHRLVSNTLLPPNGSSVPHSIKDVDILASPSDGAAFVSFSPPYHGASVLIGYEIETIQWSWLNGLVREDAESYCPVLRNDALNAPSTSSANWTLHSQRTFVSGQRATSGRVEGLSNGNCYSFRVCVRNSGGQGPPSGWSPVIVPGGTPSAPIVTAQAGDRSATVQWTIPQNNGRALIEFEVILVW